MGRPFYSRIAQQWHEATGDRGGPFKRYVLNDILLDEIGSIEGRRILEIGAGNGYFMPLVLLRHPGEQPARVVVTDHSGALLQIAREQFGIDGAEYEAVNVSRPFPFESDSFDLVLASMVLNELPDPAFDVAVRECHRVLASSGQLIASITHPEFVATLESNGKLSQLSPGFWTMPGAGALRVPVVIRSESEYVTGLGGAGFDVRSKPIYPSADVLEERPGLRHAGDVPLGLLLTCRKSEVVLG